MIKTAKIVVLSLFSAMIVSSLLVLLLPTLGVRIYSVQTGSMEPNIKAGDLVIVSSIPNESINVGDVVTFTTKQSNATVTHRVIETPSDANDGKFITQGDANRGPDDPIDPEQIIGNVGWSIPYIGKLVDAVFHPLGLLALIYLPAIFVVIEEVKRLARYYASLRWRHPSYKGQSGSANINPRTILSGAIVVAMFISLPAHAMLIDKATLVSNTITSEASPEPDCDNSSQTDIDFEGEGGGTVDIDIDVDQDAQSGDATVSDNTEGGSATTGDACNSSDIDINISL